VKHNFLYRQFDPQADEATATIVTEIKSLGEAHKTQISEVKTKVENLETKVGEVETKTAKVIADEVDKFRTEFDTNMAKLGTQFAASEKKEEKTFNQIIGETIEANINEIKSFKSGQEKRFRLAGFEDESVKEVKTVGDMSTANFVGNANYVTDFRSRIVEVPYNNVWLSDAIPNESSSSGASVMYPKENGGEGAAALWTDPTADKAQMDFDLTTQSAYFKWIAGFVIVAREMLDDIPFMTAYIQSRMLRSLKTAENDFILNGSSDTNPVSGIADLATAYSGPYTDAVRMIIDAAYGQIPEDTNNFYNPTTVIMRPRRAVEIGLNQADGSGEFDLPQNSVAFGAGRLTLAGLQTVTTSQVGESTFYALDRNALMFIRRMSPELRMFEDATLAKKNKIMFRIEERATLIGFNNSAIVTGTLPAAVVS
jgi:HK97 family phage major capsid protein